MSTSELDADLIRVASAANNQEASILRSYLEHHDIHVYVQGENHRSMLGMVGAYIDLNIMVPRHAAEEARRLLDEFHAADIEPDHSPETRGPFRDEDDDEDDDTEHALKMETRRAVRGARMVSLFLPFGTGHFAAGARRVGLVFMLLSLVGLGLAVSGNPSLGVLWPIAVVVDFMLVPRVVRRRLHKRVASSS